MPIFSPRQLMPWNLFISLVIWLYLLWIPFVTLYETTGKRKKNSERGIITRDIVTTGLNSVTIGVLVLQIVINFNSGFYYGGILIVDRHQIRQRYLGWHLLVDFVGLLAQASYLLFSSPFWRLLFLVKISSLVRYHRCIENELCLHPTAAKVYSIVRAVLIYYLFANTASCVFYFIDYYLYSQQGMYAFHELSYYQTAQLWLMQTGAMNWIITWPIQVEYLYSMYWALITAATIGYGDITPKNIIEVVYVIVFFAPNILFYSYMINMAFGGFQELTERTNIKLTKVARIHNMLIHYKVNSRYLQLVQSYVAEGVEESDNTNTAKEVTQQLSRQLRQELMLEIYRQTFKDFVGFDTGFLLLLSDTVVEQSYFQREVADPLNSYLYVYSGKLALRLRGTDAAEMEEFVTLGEVKQGTAVNSYEFITNRPNHLIDYYTRQATILYKVCRLKLIADERFWKYRRKLFGLSLSLQLNETQQPKSCQACKLEHYLHECPLFVYLHRRSINRLIRKNSMIGMCDTDHKQRDGTFLRSLHRNPLQRLRRPICSFRLFEESYSQDLTLNSY